MTLQFIPDIDSTIQDMASSIKPNGLIVFAVFNPGYITACLQAQKFFSKVDSEKHPRDGFLTINGVEIPVFIRREKEYDFLFAKHGFKQVFHQVPPFTKAFKKKYPMYDSVHMPEYLILGYERQQI